MFEQPHRPHACTEERKGMWNKGIYCQRIKYVPSGPLQRLLATVTNAHMEAASVKKSNAQQVSKKL